MFRSTAHTSGGFTLIEVMVSLVIFSVVVTMAVAAILSLVNAGENARSINSVMENLNSGLETMARDIRVGSSYGCYAYSGSGVGGVATCSSSGNTGITFSDDVGNPVAYAYDTSHSNADPYAGQIVKIDLTANEVLPITAKEVHITNMNFAVFNANGVGVDTLLARPYAVIDIDGYVESRTSDKVVFDLQTTMAERSQ